MIVAVVTAVAVAVVATAVAVTHSSAGTHPKPGAAASSQPSASPTSTVTDTAAQDAAVQALLDRRAAALTKGDLAGWLADVDPDQPALLAHQRMLFANLRKLPFSLFRYGPADSEIRGDHTVPATILSQLTDQQGVYSPGITLFYQFRGYDQVPVDDQYVPIFLLRSGKWLLAGDQTSSQEDYRWVEPWDTEPIVVGTGHHSLVVLSASDAKRLPAMVAQADAALAKVAAMWPVGAHNAILFDTRNVDVFATYLGSSVPTGEYDGITRALGAGASTRAQDDLRVVANPSYDPPGSSGIPALLRHEFTHVAKWADSSDGTPLWATEGIAEYTAYRGHPTDQRVSAQIGKDASKGRLSKTLPTTKSFYADATAYYDYGIAWCTFEYISERYTETKVRALYEALAKVPGTPDSAAAHAAEAKAFQSVFHLSEASFVKGLNAWIKQVIRPVN